MARRQPKPRRDDPRFAPYLATEGQLRELLDAQKEFAAGYLAGGADLMPPHLIVLAHEYPRAPEPSRLLYALHVPFNEDDEKRAVLARIANDLYSQRRVPIACSLLSEAWRAPLQKGVEPRDLPQRREVLIAAAVAIDRRAVCADALLTRNGVGHISIGPWHDWRPVRFPLLDAFWLAYARAVTAAMARRN